MKKLLSLATMFAILLSMACENIEKDDDFVIIDWAPIEMYIYLSDADGNNLLDPASEECYDSANITLTYNGEQYSVDNWLREDNEPMAKPLEYFAEFGLIYITRDRNGVAYMTVGEWAGGGHKWDMCSVEIAWGDGTTDTFAFSSDYTYNKKYRNDSSRNWGYTFMRNAYLNGRELTEDEYNGGIKIVYELVK